MKVLEILEWLSRYGFIDITFGIGVFTLAAKFFRSKIKSRIDGVSLLPHIDVNQSNFILMIKNQSTLPLYIYQATIKPGYHSDQVDNTSFKTKLKTWIFTTYKRDTFPRMHIPQTTDGLYILQVQGLDDNISPTLFIEPFRHAEYFIEIGGVSDVYPNNPNLVFEEKKFGTLTFMFVHGVDAGQFTLQI